MFSNILAYIIRHLLVSCACAGVQSEADLVELAGMTNVCPDHGALCEVEFYHSLQVYSSGP